MQVSSYDPMDLSLDNDPFPEFSKEECLKREIAYTIAALAFAFFRSEEFLYRSEDKFIVNCMQSQFSNEVVFEIQEYIGEVLMPNKSATLFESREIYALGKPLNPYFALSMAFKYVTKELLHPPTLMQPHVEHLKKQIPIIAEIWSHFHRLLKDFSCLLYTQKTWEENVSLAKGHFSNTRLPKTHLNFAIKAVAVNHLALQDYLTTLAKEESNFISCFNRVCNEWPNIKANWKPEERESAELSISLRKKC